MLHYFEVVIYPSPYCLSVKFCWLEENISSYLHYSVLSSVSNCIDICIKNICDNLWSVCVCSVVSYVQPLVTPWSVARWVPLSMGFSRQEYWSGLPFSLPGDLSQPRKMFLDLLHWQAGSLLRHQASPTCELLGSNCYLIFHWCS